MPPAGGSGGRRTSCNSTASRVPLMTGLPTRTLGSTVMRSRQFISIAPRITTTSLTVGKIDPLRLSNERLVVVASLLRIGVKMTMQLGRGVGEEGSARLEKGRFDGRAKPSPRRDDIFFLV